MSSDTVVLCTHVTVNGIPFAPNCQNVAHSSVVPKIVRTVVGEVLYAVDHLPETVDDTVKSLDPTTCALLQALAPVVDDRVNQWSLLYIDPAQGDLYVLGTQDSAMVHDCPPYRV